MDDRKVINFLVQTVDIANLLKEARTNADEAESQVSFIKDEQHTLKHMVEALNHAATDLESTQEYLEDAIDALNMLAEGIEETLPTLRPWWQGVHTERKD